MDAYHSRAPRSELDREFLRRGVVESALNLDLLFPRLLRDMRSLMDVDDFILLSLKSRAIRSLMDEQDCIRFL